MTEERQAAELNAAVARALIRAMGMQAENQRRALHGESPAYIEEHFLNVIDSEGIETMHIDESDVARLKTEIAKLKEDNPGITATIYPITEKSNSDKNNISDEYTLYPKLSEEAQKEAEALFVDFKNKMEKIAKEVLSELYTDIALYIESDSWTNFRNELLDGLQNYNNRKIGHMYDFKKIRQAIFQEYRGDIIADLNQDLVEENKKLKEEIERLREGYRFRNSGL